MCEELGCVGEEGSLFFQSNSFVLSSVTLWRKRGNVMATFKAEDL